MPEAEHGTVGKQIGRRGEALRSAQSEVLMERAVGEPLITSAVEGEAESLLRPQQDRNAVWRWHVRRRRRAS